MTDTLEPPLAPPAAPRVEIRTYPVCAIPIADLDTAAAAEQIVRAAVSATSLQVHLCNAYTLSLVDRDPLLRDALLASDLNLADGTPVAWLGRTQGTSGPVRGPGLVGAVAALGVGVTRHYLWGGKDGVADGMADGLRMAVPGVSIVGTETPPFAPLTDQDLIDLAVRVRASGANVLWVGPGHTEPGLRRTTSRAVARDADRAGRCGLRLLVRRGFGSTGVPARLRPGVGLPALA